MSQIELKSSIRRELRAQAHRLNPIVIIGADGLTPAVLKEIDTALNAHGLIKVRVFSDDRAERDAYFAKITHELDAAAVQHIGKLLVLWRTLPEKEKKVDENRKSAPKEYKIVKQRKPGQKPEIKRVSVFGNQRVTPAGNIKRVKSRSPVSIKKRQSD